jgi:hypothetical protein
MQQSPELLAAVASFLADGMIPARHFSFELLKLKRMLHGGEYVKRVEKNEENGDGVNRSTWSNQRKCQYRCDKKVGRGLSDQQKALLLENVPDYLKSTGTGWLFWRYGELASNGYREKVPHDVDTGCFANINDVGGTLKDAINACGFWNGDGVGYSVIPTDHLVGWEQY